MRETKNHVSAMIQTNVNEAEKYSSLSEKAWTVYYYLLSISNYNNEEKDHRFVYRSDFNIAAVSKSLKIGRSTFYTCLDKLIKYNLITYSTRGNYYTIPIRFGWARLKKDLLNELLGYSSVLGIDLLRTYLFIKVVNEKNYGKNSFTRRNLIRCLGHCDTSTEFYYKIDIYLNLLEKWQLVYLDERTMTADFGTYKIYHIVKVNDESSYLAEQDKNRVKENSNPYGLTKEEEDDIKELV